MISDADIDLHIPDDVPPIWAETNFFGWSIPEHRLMGHVYLVARAGVGLTQGEVIAIGKLSGDRADCLYVDARPSMPLIDRLSRARTLSGIEIDAHNRQEFDVRYRSDEGFEINLHYRGLMENFDITDPDHSPLAKPASEDHAANFLKKTAFGNHFDLTCHVTGYVRIGAHELKVDCVETIDHSWGPRPEIGIPANGWMHAHFGTDLAIHWINRWDRTKTSVAANQLAHGYVMENGQAYGLTDLQLDVTRLGNVITGIVATATDKRGKTFQMRGHALIGAPIVQYMHMDIFTCLVEWTLHDGRTGHGTAMEGASILEKTRPNRLNWSPAAPIAK